MKAKQNFQSIPLATPEQMDDSSEGGLQVGEILAAIRRRAIFVFGTAILMATLAAYKASKDTPVYQAKFEILTETATAETQVVSSVPGTFSSKSDAATGAVDATKLKVLQSPRILTPIVDRVRSKYPNITYGELLGNLSIGTLGPTTNVLQVSYRSTDRKQVTFILDLVGKAFLSYSLEERQKDIQQGIKFVEEQLPQLQLRVENLEDKLQKFRQQYNSIDPESQSQQLTSQVNSLKQQQIDTQVKLDEARSMYADLKTELSQKPAESTAASALTENPRYQKILDQILTLDIQIANDSSRFLNTTPSIQSLREKRENLLPLLAKERLQVEREVANQIRNLEARNQALKVAIDRLNLQVDRLPIIAREYNDIQQGLKIANDNLNQFLTKREALRIDSAQREVPWQILTPISDPEASSSNVKKNFVLGAILGTVLGLGVALIVDNLVNVVYSKDQLKNLTKIPILGAIPFEKELNNLTSDSINSKAFDRFAKYYFKILNKSNLSLESKSQFLESFRSLYANINRFNFDTPIRSLVVTSSAPKEGKSTVALYLAQAAAAMEQRVLLVDTNLRYPSLHDRLGLVNNQGLTDIIIKDLDFKDVIQQSFTEERLFVLTTGSISIEPYRILTSHKMQYLMEKFHSYFDLVIYDTPPILGLADVRLMAGCTSGIILVVGLGKVKHSLFKQVLNELKLSNTSVLGLVANQ